jgi:hypothetical protein
LTRPGLAVFIDTVFCNHGDEYASVTMGRDFVCGYWDDRFDLIY